MEQVKYDLKLEVYALCLWCMVPNRWSFRGHGTVEAAGERGEFWKTFMIMARKWFEGLNLGDGVPKVNLSVVWLSPCLFYTFSKSHFISK